jgi:hypothetical protein
MICYNNAVRRDVIAAYWSNTPTYYIFKGTDGKTVTEWIESDWEGYGAQFESIATGLLLAENANIGGWIFKNEKLNSQSGGAYLDGRTGNVSITGDFTSTDGSYKSSIKDGSLSLSADNKQLARLQGSTENWGAGGLLKLYTYDGAALYATGIFTPTDLSMSQSSTNGFSVSLQPSRTYMGMINPYLTLKNIPTSVVGLPAWGVYRQGDSLYINVPDNG